MKREGIKEAVKEKAKWANEKAKESKCTYSEDYCVLNDIACGDFREDVCELVKPKTTRHSYHYLINGQYGDPDTDSHIMYLIACHKYNKKLKQFENLKIKKFNVKVRNDYNFCLEAEFDEKENNILLGGDWAFSWNLISKCEENLRWEIITNTHTIKGHPMWPCKRRNYNTVNQIRGDKITMYQTLLVLKECYNEWNAKTCQYEETSITLKQKESLKKAFNEYKKWYQCFGDFDIYVQFWDLDIYTEEIDETNIYQKFCN